MNDTQKMYVKSDAQAAARDSSPFVTMSIKDILRTLGIGAMVGVVSIGLYSLLNRFVFGAALCRPGIEGCASAPIYSAAIATVFGAILGVVALARVGVYRPLPAAIAASVAMWGVYSLGSNVAWYWVLIGGAILYGLAYLLFAWIARMRSFIISILALVVVAVIVRLVIG